MRQAERIRPEFVESVPPELIEGVLYISLRNKTVLHLCCCGCGEEVETPLSPAEWCLTYDGEDVSLSPSVGNWGLECKAHYWIQRGRIKWADRWSAEKIEAVRSRDSLDFHRTVVEKSEVEEKTLDAQTEPGTTEPKIRFWARIRKALGL